MRGCPAIGIGPIGCRRRRVADRGTLTLVAELLPDAGVAEELVAVRTDRPAGHPVAESN